MKGMSAEWCGALRPGDRLIRIGGEPVVGLSVLACRARLIGPRRVRAAAASAEPDTSPRRPALGSGARERAHERARVSRLLTRGELPSGRPLVRISPARARQRPRA